LNKKLPKKRGTQVATISAARRKVRRKEGIEEEDYEEQNM
jgi:hypothetical protein